MRLFRFFNDMKLGIRLRLTLVLMLSSLLAAILFVVNQRVADLVVHTGQDRAGQEAAVIQSRFAEAGQNVIQETKLLAFTQGLVEAVTGKDASSVRSLILVNAATLDLDDISVVDADGARVTVVTQPGETVNITQENALVSQVLLGVETTGVLVEKEPAGLRFRLAALTPLRDRSSGAIVGGLLASRTVDDESLAEINLGRGNIQLGLIYDGKVVAGSLPTQPDQAAVEQALGGEIVIVPSLSYGSDGLPYAQAYVPLVIGQNAQTVVDVSINMNELLAFQGQLITGMALTFVLLALAALVAMAFFVSRVLISPLQHLTGVAQDVTRGDLQAEAKVYAGNEIGMLAAAFNAMTARLREALEGLEVRVAGRTRALETTAEVSRRLSTILDQKQLVAEVVQQLQAAFGYYHAHIYLVDEANREVVMAGGTGEPGRKMLAAGHKLPWGKGLVGRAATSGAPVLVPDVSQDKTWLPNPLLPETKAEIAVPIMSGERVLGVLDVQNNVTGSLSRDDADLLRSIAGQAAIALQNVRLFSEARRRAEQQALINLVTQRIQGATTVEAVLQVAARELGQALGAQRTSVQLTLVPEGDHSRERGEDQAYA